MLSDNHEDGKKRNQNKTHKKHTDEILNFFLFKIFT